ncbi:MAG: chitobiase/beta-hexosaminidase C-terminal domain-containing protein [Prevotella sp.]|nr:chitobiase/beta-hexosaminidase C-terminal domain-containing protein [Prevotella sp.]
MKRLFFISLLLGMLSPVLQTAKADGVLHVAFSEAFSSNNVTGGRDGDYGAGSGTPHYDLDGWSGTNTNKVYGANKCIRIGTSTDNGTCSTPEIVLIGTAKTATLTFNAAGWSSGTNKLTVTANEGVTLSGDTEVTLGNSTWTSYTVTVTLTTAKSVQLTFTGKRGFLDDVKVQETVTAINAPTLSDGFYFWPKTTEAIATSNITLTPSDSTTVYYTTDGSEPSSSNGAVATMTSNIVINGTTTVKAIGYYGSVVSSVVSSTYTQGSTVNSISAFRDLSVDTEARLFLDDDNSHEARVLYYDETRHQLFVRDQTGALCIDFGSTATFNPTPQYNQHIAGWVVGRRADDSGLPKLVATDNTTTSYLAIANQVTEGQTAPKDINLAYIDDNVADWVVLQDMRVGTDVAVTDRFGTGSYTGALTDLSGIVIPNGGDKLIAPVTQNGIPGVVYVIDETKSFVAPASDINHVTVRLNRTLSSDNWNTFAVPFDIASLDGYIREFDEADGNVLKFKNASSIVAGTPYLVKPAADIVNPTYSDVTLSATAAQTITKGDYSFAAIYQPTDLATDKTELFLKTDGKLYYPTALGTQLRGMRAFFRAPAGVTARVLVFDDELTEIQKMSTVDSHSDQVYDLQGRPVSVSASMPKGIYVVRGKKIVIR